MGQSARFWDRIANRYSKKPIADEAAYQRKLQVTREYFRSDMQVLEIGCGTGSTAIAHAPFVEHIRAIDISSKMIEIARARADAADIRNVTFEVTSIEESGAPGHDLDAILALSVLHLMENTEETIAKAHDMLKPGGIFVSSTVCLGDKMKFFRFVGPIGKFLGLMPEVNVFTVSELEAGILRAGFEIDYQWQPDKGLSVFIVAKKSW